MTSFAMSLSVDYHVRWAYYSLLALWFRYCDVLFAFYIVNSSNLLSAMYGSCIKINLPTQCLYLHDNGWRVRLIIMSRYTTKHQMLILLKCLCQVGKVGRGIFVYGISVLPLSTIFYWEFGTVVFFWFTFIYKCFLFVYWYNGVICYIPLCIYLHVLWLFYFEWSVKL